MKQGKDNKRRIAEWMAAFAAALVVGCVLWCRAYSESRTCTKQIFAMDTVMSFTAYGKNCEEAVEAAVQEIQRLDALLSTGNSSSEVFRINEAGGGALSADAAALFQKAMEIYEKTGGLFDFTIYPLMELWGFPSREYHIPSEAELKTVLSLVNASRVHMDGNQVALGKGQQVDFGGIAKGYASAKVMEIYREHDIASGMVSLGGNVQVLGKKPDDSDWRVGIKDPRNSEGELAAVVNVENRAVVTSGGYERYFEKDGNTYIHILDPRTGCPTKGDLASVTVVSEDGTLADALSTALYIMGKEDAVSYWRDYGEDFEMVLITDKGELFVTEGMSGDIWAEVQPINVNRKMKKIDFK